MTFSARSHRPICSVLLAACGLLTVGRAEPSIWSPADLPTAVNTRALAATHGKSARAFALNHSSLRAALNNAPHEREIPAGLSKARIDIPRPDGALARFRLVEAPIMEPELAAKF